MITLNGHKVDVTIFPDGTSQVWNIGEFVDNKENVVVWDFDRKESELFHLKQLKALMDHILYGRGYSHSCENTLIMPYLPYARQDRQIDDKESFALQVFAKEINGQSWDLVRAFDTHNMWGTNIAIRNFQTIRPDISFAEDYDVVIFPDAGAATRYGGEYGSLKGFKNILVGDKVRDPATGYITSYQIDATKIKGKKVLVVDDLCDGGMTFMILGKELGNQALRLDLYVSHGLFSKGLLDLLRIYGKIITTDSMVHLMDWDKTTIIDRQYVLQIPNSELKKALSNDPLKSRFEVRKLDIRN